VPKQCETGSQIIDNQERKRESEWVFRCRNKYMWCQPLSPVESHTRCAAAAFRELSAL